MTKTLLKVKAVHTIEIWAVSYILHKIEDGLLEICSDMKSLDVDPKLVAKTEGLLSSVQDVLFDVDALEAKYREDKTND